MTFKHLRTGRFRLRHISQGSEPESCTRSSEHSSAMPFIVSASWSAKTPTRSGRRCASRASTCCAVVAPVGARSLRLPSAFAILAAWPIVTWRRLGANTMPMKSAPSEAAARACCASMTPQILTSGGASAARMGKQLRYLRDRVCGGDQRLADEDGIDAAGLHALHVGGRMDARLCNQRHRARDHGSQALRGCQVNVECAQIAVVDAEELGAGLQGLLHLGDVMHLDQRVHAERSRQRYEVAEETRLQHGGDQQETIGAGGPRLVDLVGVEEEVLA